MKSLKDFIAEDAGHKIIASDHIDGRREHHHTYGTINGKPFHHRANASYEPNLKKNYENVTSRGSDLSGDHLSETEINALHHHIAKIHSNNWGDMVDEYKGSR